MANPVLVALAVTTLAVVSCGGRVDSGGSGGGNPPPSTSSSENDADAAAADGAPVNVSGAALTCADAIHVSIGEMFTGTTCGGTYRPVNETVCSHRGPVAFFYVDAPSGAAFSIDSTDTLITVGYDDCADTKECATGTSVAPSVPDLRLFSVQLPGYDWTSDTCGAFTITVEGQ